MARNIARSIALVEDLPSKGKNSAKKEKPSLDGIVAQVQEACKPKNRLATSLGALLAGIVPLASYVLVHSELDHTRSILTQLPAWIAFGGLAFSFLTVFHWAQKAFENWVKAAGFVILLEGVMVASKTGWLGIAALCYLIVINAVATGCRLSIRA